MTRSITAPELVKLRSLGQFSLMHVLIDAPDTVYTARATGAVVKSTYSIAFDGGSGTLTDCLADMTLLIGSSAGAYDKGITRLRKAPAAGVFYIGADPSLSVADNDYLTVINDFGLFAKHDVGSYLDVDVAHSDQFTSFLPVAVIQGGRCAVINAAGTASFDASASWVPGSTISGYSWTFTGATSTTGTTTATPTATYNTSGRYRWSLTLTAATAKTAIFFGWVYVIGATLLPDASAELGSIDSDDAGWATKMVLYTRPTIRDGARVIIYAEDYYADTLGSLGPVTGRENVVFVGWIIGETIVRDPAKSTVEFEVGGPLVALSRIASNPLGLVNPTFPDDSATNLPAWAKMASMTAARSLHYLINYRSTIAKVVDVDVEDYAYPVHKLNADGSDLLSHLVNFAENAVLTVRADRYGVINIERDGQLYTYASRTANIPAVMTMTDADWTEELTVVRRQFSGVGTASVEGYAFSGGVLNKIGGISPGNQPYRFGSTKGLDEVNVSTQAQVIELAGLMAGAENTEYAAVMTTLRTNRFIDVTPRQFVTVTIDGDTVRCFPRRISFELNDESGFWDTKIELEPEGVQWPAIAIVYPGNGGDDDPGTDPPPTPDPTPPPIPEPEPEPEPVIEPGDNDAIAVIPSDVRITADLDEASPTWTSELA